MFDFSKKFVTILLFICRYFVIVTGKEILFLTKPRYTIIVISAIWILSGVLASPIMFAMKISPVLYQNTTYVECSEDWSFMESITHIHSFGTKYTVVVFVATFVFPTIALCYLYGHIGFIVLKHKMPDGNDNCVSNRNLTQTKLKVSAIVLFVIFIYLLTHYKHHLSAVLCIEKVDIVLWILELSLNITSIERFMSKKIFFSHDLFSYQQ